MRKSTRSRSRTDVSSGGGNTKPRFLPLVEVAWRDAAGDPTWKHSSDVDPESCYLVGYLISETKTKMSFVMAVAEDGDTFMRFAVPRDWVQKVRKLGVSRWVKVSR